MKKLYLSLLGLFTAFLSFAGIEFPYDFQKNFEFNQNTLDGWTIYAPAGTPSGEYSTVFENYSPSNAVAIAARFSYETLCFAWTNSEYSNGQPSDTWLITPEFEVTMDTEVLAFTVCVIGMDNTVSNNVSVYISESGVEKEDFKLINQTTVKGSIYGQYDFETVDRRYEFSGYKGKKVRLAFVNENNYVGIMGFASISLSSWYASGYPEPSTFSEILVGNGGDASFDLSFQASTPLTTTSYTVDFKTSGGFNYTATERKQLRLASLTTISVNIPNIQLKDPVEEFTLSITPQFKGAVPFVVTGSFISAERIYDQVSVLEEGTGTWCQWCPYGAVALDYYTHKYPASGEGNKVIGIAIHDSDPMQISPSISDYYQQFVTTQNVEGFPMISFNRSYNDSPSPYPNTFGPLIEQQFAQKSFVYGKLDKVYLNPENSEDMVAEFSVTSTYDSSVRPMNAAVVVIEDDVTGTGNGYNQANSVRTLDNEASIMSQFGNDWLPYFQLYLDNPGTVPYTKMVYNHVARAIYPRFAGVSLPTTPRNETYNGRISFPMPSNVGKKENTKVILIITDSASGEIITADEMDYSEFTMASGVKGVAQESDAFGCSLSGGVLTITSAREAVATLYGIDGSIVDTFSIERGVNNFPVASSQNILLLNVKGEKLNKTVKLINR